MLWIRLDADFPEHPKVVALSDEAFRAHVVAMCYARRYLTDGWVPPTLTRSRTAEELMGAHLWAPAAGGGYVIHDYLQYQQSRAEALERHERLSEQGKKGAQRRWGVWPEP